MIGWRLGRAEAADLVAAEAREWLVTNDRGGYASGTVAGTLTRRYHGLLVAALAPPVERRLIVAKCEIDVCYAGATYALGANRWIGGDVAPTGYRWCESFALVDGVPTWTYACGDALIEQSIAMPAERDATAVSIRLLRGSGPVRLRVRLLAADRDHHGGPLPAPERFGVAVVAGGATIALPLCGRTLHLAAPRSEVAAACERYAGFALPREAERGLQASDDYAHLLTFEQSVAVDAPGGWVVALDGPDSDGAAAIVDGSRERYRSYAAGQPSPLRGALAAAAATFIVRRGAAGVEAGKTIIAGYHWFADWGRDTMIALPGLTLRTGRPAIAREILLTFSRTIDGGMLPNRFPDDGSPPEYNTVDAALWFVEAVRAYVVATADGAFANEIFAGLEAIVDGYVGGTRYGIRVDADGLVRAGEPGVQLTWMDAKVGAHVVTPRIGKPIEISALWYAALRAIEQLAAMTGRDAERYRRLADRCAIGMQRFWNAERGYCYDVLDGPDGNDPALRPNQLFAVSQPAVALNAAQSRAVVDACARELLTSYGLRTLGPREAGYRGHYGGSPLERDSAYHQGTVWPWLIGPFVRAHLRVYADVALARTYVTPLVDALAAYGLGTLAEIFEGDAPHAPRGAIAQAWSIAELITALDATAGDGS